MTPLPKPGLLSFYRRRLVRREVSLLAAYRLFGRHPRLYYGAYWRASFTPLALGLMFFLSRSLGISDPQAALVALSLALGLVFADMRLFVLNAPTWVFARQVIRWPVIADLVEAYAGVRPDFRRPSPENRWDRVPLGKTHRRALARSYQRMRNDPPGLKALVGQSAEVRTLGLATLLLVAVLTLSPNFTGVALAVYGFVIAWPAKRLKAALDLWVTWPILQQAFDWARIDQFADGV